MARYAKVDVRIWDDERVRRLSAIQPSGQGLWIRLLVSRHRTSIPGLLCVGEAALAEEFGWTLKGFREGFQEVLRERLAKADWNARLVWIPKAIKYNPPENPNVIKGWEVPWNETPECALKDEAYRTLKEFVKGLSKGFQEAFEKGCPNRLANQEQDPDPEQEQEQEPTISAETAEPSSTPVLVFPCDGKIREWGLTQEQIDGWKALFPSRDILSDCRGALAWVLGNPSRKKTHLGMSKFLVGWIIRNQERGGQAQQAFPVRDNVKGKIITNGDW